MSEENLFIQSSEHAYLGFRWFELCSLCRRLGGRWNNRKLHKRYKDAIPSVWHWKIKRTQWTKRWEHPWQVGNFYDFGDRVGGRRMMGRKSAKTTTVVASCIHCRWFLPAASSRSPPPHPPPPPRFSISSLPSNTSCLLGKRQRANFFYCCMRFLCLGSLRFSLGFFFFCIFSLCSRLNGFAVFTFDIFGVASVGACCMRLRCVLYVAAGASIATSICPRWYRRIGASIRDLQTYYLFYVRMSNGSSCSIQLNWLLLELFCWRKSFCSLTFKC